MAVVYVQVELLETHGEQVHHVADVEVKDPVVLLVFHAQYRLHIVPQRREIGRCRVFSPSGRVVSGLVQLLLAFLLELLGHKVVSHSVDWLVQGLPRDWLLLGV